MTTPNTMTRSERHEPTENTWRMTPEEIEAWLSEGRELKASVAERVKAKAPDEKAAQLIDCLACLRDPRHEVDLGGGDRVEFCDACWAEVQARLERTGNEYHSMVASGMHPRMAERLLMNGRQSRRA